MEEKESLLISQKHYDGMVGQATKYDCMCRMLQQLSIIGDDIPISDINTLLQILGEDSFTGSHLPYDDVPEEDDLPWSIPDKPEKQTDEEMFYVGFNDNDGIVIPEIDAFSYVFQRVLVGATEFKAELVSWYFSNHEFVKMSKEDMERWTNNEPV